MLVGFGFKVAAVPFHQWAPDAYEGAPAPVTAWIATGLEDRQLRRPDEGPAPRPGPLGEPVATDLTGPGWIVIVALIAAATMTYGNFAALAQRNLKRMLAYSSIAHAGYMLVGVLAAAVSIRQRHDEAAGSVLFYLVIYGFTNLGAFAVAAWLARDKGRDDIDDLNGLGSESPGLAACIVILMLSLIGMPPLAGFFGKLYMFMEALNGPATRPGLTLLWLVALGLLNSVVSAFYYVRVLKAMFLRRADRPMPRRPSASIAWPIVLATAVAVGFGLCRPLLDRMTMRGADAASMLASTARWNGATAPTAIATTAPAGAALQERSAGPTSCIEPRRRRPGDGGRGRARGASRLSGDRDAAGADPAPGGGLGPAG